MPPPSRHQTPSLPSRSNTPNGFMHPPPVQDDIRRDLQKLKSRTDKAISSQQKDIDRISATLERIEKGMTSLRDFMNEVRTELAITKQESLTDEDLADIRREVKVVRDEVKCYKQEHHGPMQTALNDIQQNLAELHQGIELFSSDQMAAQQNAQTVGVGVAVFEELKAEMRTLRSCVDFMPVPAPHSKATLAQANGSQAPVQALELIRLSSPSEPATHSANNVILSPGNAATHCKTWVYTASRHHAHLLAAYKSFGLTYPNCNLAQKIRTLERHVNELGLQDSEYAQKFGRVAMDESLVKSSLFSKRKHDQIQVSNLEPSYCPDLILQY